MVSGLHLALIGLWRSAGRTSQTKEFMRPPIAICMFIGAPGVVCGSGPKVPPGLRRTSGAGLPGRVPRVRMAMPTAEAPSCGEPQRSERGGCIRILPVRSVQVP